MSDQTLQTAENEQSSQWETKALVIGGLVGAAAGLLGAYMLIQNVQKNGTEEPAITAREGVKLGVLVMGLLRQISTLNDG